jgi:hypothetical protein
MKNILRVIDNDVIFLSYDEPNAEKNYADLLTKIPWAKRIHGVHGSDSAHKECAKISETERLIVIDGDNIVDENFVNEEINFIKNVDITKNVISWPGRNIINGLIYGNGGIKCWDKQTLLDIKTHENADPNNIHAQVDFCWDIEYITMQKSMSVVENNFTPQQAWRAGFREGVKMCLLEGVKPSIEEFNKIHWKNLHRLYIWCMTGQDVKNGIYAILGARQGFYKTMCTDWDFINVRDFAYLNTLWNDELEGVDENSAADLAQQFGDKIKQQLDIPISSLPLSIDQSKFHKTTFTNSIRPKHPLLAADKETASYDIVMITYNELNGTENYNRLKDRFTNVKRIHKVKGIHQAHIAAAEICETDMMWVVDGDAEIVEDFCFDYIVPNNEKQFVHVWRSKNPINDLEYGYGGVKLLPTDMTRNMDLSKPDMTTSISRHFKKMDQVSNYTRFNVDKFTTWRSAFRECCKLASSVIDRQKQQETDERLERWCSDYGKDRPFGEYAILGANEGKVYGIENAGNYDMLAKINDFDWLLSTFNNEDTSNLINQNEKDFDYDKVNNIEFIHGLHEYAVYKSEKNVAENLDNILKILYSDNISKHLILDVLMNSSGENTRYFRFVRDFVKKGKNLKILSDAFSRSQMRSKIWLVDELAKIMPNPRNVVLMAGWYGQLIDLFGDKDIDKITFRKFRNIEIDKECCIESDYNFNLRRLEEHKVKAVNADINNLTLHENGYEWEVETFKTGEKYVEKFLPDLIINTSSEHMSTEWFNQIRFKKWTKKPLVVIQNNNFFGIPEHVNCVHSVDHMKKVFPMEKILFEGELQLKGYKRVMLIGYA